MVFIAIISGIGLYFSYIYKNDYIFIILLVFSILYALVQYNISKSIVLYMNGAKPVSREIAPGFYAAVETISITAGLPMPKLYIIDDESPNAFAAGTNPEKSIICATTGLLNIMNKSELEAVVAHEMSHIKNYDIRVSMAAVALTSVIELISELVLRFFIWSDDDNDNRNPLIVVLGLLFVMISPLLALVTRLAISRQREFLADATAVLLTRYPEGMISALQKLKNNGKPLRKQNSTTANLFIVNPMKRSFFQNLFSTHPSIDDRISRLKDNSSRL
ncbi:MAG: M48 family metallopeptidase [Candidatus Nanogingivalaceae bacterium]|jgi:protease htpX homolog|nr:MAG: M48 family metallopeptidase [Candidatus Nanogingivalaceae bacterium]QWB91445.1 MAG: M48 family metallopeptidase [Candidatus Nanogingivalaceae bacterium]